MIELQNYIDTSAYCDDLTSYKRRKVETVKIGKRGLGNNDPIRVQSMTTVDTMDTEGSVAESIRMIEKGCEFIRITAPSKKEANHLKVIKDELLAKGYDNPLIADIHYTPNAAEVAATLIEKVRINPGNYADKKKFQVLEYTDETYQAEVDRIEKRFMPLVELCKKENTAMRIGTNHGSLSDRILSRYGDTPMGMVESAMEFLRICQKADFKKIVVSMKSSNPIVMIQAYRLLIVKMKKENMFFPLHLGVTEAGDGIDGRIKSAVGIGSLLDDGIGDTIRVSLTEAPEEEIPVGLLLRSRAERLAKSEEKHLPVLENVISNEYNPFAYTRRNTLKVNNVGNHQVPVITADLSHYTEEIKASQLFNWGYIYNKETDKWKLTDQAVDYLFVGDKNITFELPGTLNVIQDFTTWEKSKKAQHYPLLSYKKWLELNGDLNTLTFIKVNAEEVNAELVEHLKQQQNIVVVLNTSRANRVAAFRYAMFQLVQLDCHTPVIFQNHYQQLAIDDFVINSATDNGSLFIDGFGDGIWLTAPNMTNETIKQVSFGILQATRTRISKTEYISCPSCGRTLFDLQETTNKIRKETNHLKGLKIGIMGCIVNGPGEMADADYGYVGTGKGVITLYKEQEVVKKNVPENEAVKELVELIKSHGDWVDAK